MSLGLTNTGSTVYEADDFYPNGSSMHRSAIYWWESARGWALGRHINDQLRNTVTNHPCSVRTPVVVIAAHWVHSATSSIDGMNPALAASYCCMEENIAAA